MIAEIQNSPQNTGAPFAVAIHQPSGSAIRPTVIVRAKMQARIGVVLFETWLEIGRHTFEPPSLVGGAGDRVVAVGAIPGASGYQAECSAADLEDIEIQTGPYNALVEPLTWLDSNNETPAGTATAIEVGTPPAGQGALSVGVHQDDTSVAACFVVIEASFESGYVELGRYQFSAPGPSGPGDRVVAVCDVPGAISYRITAISADGARPYALVGAYKNVSSPLAWLIGGAVPVPPVTGNQPETVTYVAPNGNNTTGERGNYHAPFATINAALAAIEPGDTIMIAPGEYGACVVPPGLFCTLIGMGDTTTPSVSISALEGGEALFWQPIGGDSLVLRNLLLQTTDALAYALAVQGSSLVNNATFTAENTFWFSNASSDALFEFLAVLNLDRCGGRMIISNVNGADSSCFGHQFGEVEVEVQEPIPGPVMLGRMQFKSCKFNGTTGINMRANGQATFDRGCFATTVTTEGGAGPIGPSGYLNFSGEADASMLEIDDGFSDRISLVDARILSPVLTSTAIAGSRPYINARGAKFDLVAMADAGADEFILDVRGGSINYITSFFDTHSRVLRDSGGGTLLTVAPGVNVYTFSSLGGSLPGPAYPVTQRPGYTITPMVLGVLPTDQMAITAADADGFTITSGYAGSQDVQFNYAFTL